MNILSSFLLGGNAKEVQMTPFNGFEGEPCWLRKKASKKACDAVSHASNSWWPLEGMAWSMGLHYTVLFEGPCFNTRPHDGWNLDFSIFQSMFFLWECFSTVKGKERKGTEGFCGLWLLWLLAFLAFGFGDLSLWLVASVSFGFGGFWRPWLWLL